MTDEQVKKTYLAITVLFWSIIGLFAAIIAGALSGADVRSQIFFIVLALGIVWLISLWVIASRQPSVGRTSQKLLSAPSSLPKTVKRQIHSQDGTHRILSPDEAREWLDDFLVKQQDDSRQP